MLLAAVGVVFGAPDSSGCSPAFSSEMSGKPLGDATGLLLAQGVAGHLVEPDDEGQHEAIAEEN